MRRECRRRRQLVRVGWRKSCLSEDGSRHARGHSRSTTWHDIATEVSSSYRRLQGINAWNVDIPSGGAIGIAGALVPGDM